MTVVVPLVCGRLIINRARLSGQPLDGQWDVPVMAYLIRHPKGELLFDTGLPLMLMQERPYLELRPGITAFPGSSGGVLQELAKVGLHPGDIKLVINSHLHLDHAGGNYLFNQAQFYVHANELNLIRASDYNREVFGPINRYVPVAGKVDIFADGTCLLLETRGHSPGHQSLLVNGTSGKILLTGDACFRPDNLMDLTLPLLLHDQDEALRSLTLLREISLQQQAAVFTSHDPVFLLNASEHQHALKKQ